MKLKNIIYSGLIILLFVEVLLVFPKIIEDDQPSAKKSDSSGKIQKNESDQVMQGVHLVESNGKMKDWELFANQAEGSQQTGRWTLSEVKVQFYTVGQIEFVVQGQSGRILGPSRDLEVEGNVLVESANGYQFKTSRLVYDASSRTLTSPGVVQMKGPPEQFSNGVELKGTGLIASVDTTLMTIRGPVTATRKISNDKLFRVSSGQAKVSGRSRVIDFSGAVNIQYDGMTLQGPEANFSYSSENVLSQIQMKSGVDFNDAEKTAQAGEMIFDIVKNQLRFKGQPKVVQDEDEFSGEEIILLDGGKKVKVERLRAKVENKAK